jgi:hypothetical protein
MAALACRKIELEWALANPSSKNTFMGAHSLQSAASEIQKYIKAARQALGPIIVEVTPLPAAGHLAVLLGLFGWLDVECANPYLAGQPQGGFYGHQHGGFFDPSGQLNPTAFVRQDV